jgi:hypothetical protein
MADPPEEHPLAALEPLVGEWSMDAVFSGGATASESERSEGARTVFEWLPGRNFLVQRWELPHPAAPDGIALIGLDRDRQNYVQHYFDSRGVARVYEMSFGGGVWKLWRTSPDFSPLDFSQRFTGFFNDDGAVIGGDWERSADGASWDHDFELVYTKVP